MQFIADIGPLSKCGRSLGFVSDSHKRRALLSHLVDLSLCFRDETPEAGKGSHSELSGWWVAEAPGALPPVPFLADSTSRTSRAKVFSLRLSSTGLSPDSAPWARHFDLGKRQQPPRHGRLPATS